MPPNPDKKRPLARPVGAPPPKDRDTETRILDAARAVFVRKGTSGARVQDIAAEAGVNQALVHYYFGSKDVLAERVFLEAASAVAGAFAPVPDPSLTLEQMIERFVVGYVRAVRQAPFIPAYLMAEAHHHPERLDALFEAAIGTVPATLMQTTLAHVERVIAERVAAGSMRPMSPRQLLVSVMALTVFPFVARPILVAAFRLDGEGFERFLDERIAELPGFIINALRP